MGLVVGRRMIKWATGVIFCWQPEGFFNNSFGGMFMDIKLHKQATTTPKIRDELQAALTNVSDSALARQYGVSDSTIPPL